MKRTIFRRFVKWNLKAMAGVLFILAGMVFFYNYINAATLPTDCGALATVPANFPNDQDFGCACGYYYTISQNTGAQLVTCDFRSNLVCSRNDYTPTYPVTTSKTSTQKVSVKDFCLLKTDSPCKSHIECEQGHLCVGGACKLDVGGSTVEGIAGGEITDVRDTIRRLINIVLGFLGVVVVIMIMYGGFLWLTAAGNDDRISKGRHTIMWAALGAIIISIAWTIASYVLNLSREIG